MEYKTIAIRKPSVFSWNWYVCFAMMETTNLAHNLESSASFPASGCREGHHLRKLNEMANRVLGAG
jgi:hypothetical protein